eukprot:5958922-Prymnesium_polylepis.1
MVRSCTLMPCTSTDAPSAGPPLVACAAAFASLIPSSSRTCVKRSAASAKCCASFTTLSSALAAASLDTPSLPAPMAASSPPLHMRSAAGGRDALEFRRDCSTAWPASSAAPSALSIGPNAAERPSSKRSIARL